MENLKKLPEELESVASSLTFKETKTLKTKKINLRELSNGDAEEKALVALLELREVKAETYEKLEYAVLLAFLLRVIQATYNPSEDVAVKS